MAPLESCSKPLRQTLHIAFLSQHVLSQQMNRPGPHTSRRSQAMCAAKRMLY